MNECGRTKVSEEFHKQQQVAEETHVKVRVQMFHLETTQVQTRLWNVESDYKTIYCMDAFIHYLCIYSQKENIIQNVKLCEKYITYNIIYNIYVREIFLIYFFVEF